MSDSRRELVRQILGAAERGDRFSFTAAARRYGSLEEAQMLVREEGVVRMVDRIARRAVGGVVGERRDYQLRMRANLRAGEDEVGSGTLMYGHFAVFDTWTEIDSWFEGHFLERIAPGAFKKTFRENRSEIKPLFQHGYDPVVGEKPLGPVDDLREDETGAYYEVPLLDASYVRDDILPGLREGLYGASFAFKMMREEFDDEPNVSDANPKGLPERTLKELRVYEFSPVTFPAYLAATAAVRADTTDFTTTPPAEDAATNGATPALAGAGSRSHLDLGRRGTSTYSLDRKEAPRWRLP